MTIWCILIWSFFSIQYSISCFATCPLASLWMVKASFRVSGLESSLTRSLLARNNWYVGNRRGGGEVSWKRRQEYLNTALPLKCMCIYPAFAWCSSLIVKTRTKTAGFTSASGSEDHAGPAVVPQTNYIRSSYYKVKEAFAVKCYLINPIFFLWHERSSSLFTSVFTINVIICHIKYDLAFFFFYFPPFPAGHISISVS